MDTTKKKTPEEAVRTFLDAYNKGYRGHEGGPHAL